MQGMPSVKGYQDKARLTAAARHLLEESGFISEFVCGCFGTYSYFVTFVATGQAWQFASDVEAATILLSVRTL